MGELTKLLLIIPLALSISMGVLIGFLSIIHKNDKPITIKIPKEETIKNTININPYLPKKYILTSNEFACYKNMKIIADKYGLEIFCKVRFADLIETRQNKDFYKWFNKVKSKHIDFVLLDEKRMIPKILIELDDRTHDLEDRKKRDQFVDSVCAMCELKIRHIRGYQVEYLEKILIEENIIPSISVMKSTQAQ